MFTGIISHLGKIITKGDTSLEIEAALNLCRKLQKGTSIALNGICLTVITEPVENIFSVEIMPETFKRTTLGQLSVGKIVNLELPATPDSLLSGHIVQGHIDTTGKITNIKEEGNSHLITVAIPEKWNKYIIEKGSIAINGISLTIIDANLTYFTVGIIPFTWENTMIHLVKIDDLVNIEFDVIAKYVNRSLTN